MDDIEVMLIERACERLVTEYCHLVDHGEAARIADLFADDGVFHFDEGVFHIASGRETLREFFQSRQDQTGRMSRHVCNNTLIEVIDADNARGVTYLTLYRHDGEPGRSHSPLSGPTFVGEYRDNFARTADGWRFKERQGIVDFRRDADTA